MSKSDNNGQSVKFTLPQKSDITDVITSIVEDDQDPEAWFKEHKDLLSFHDLSSLVVSSWEMKRFMSKDTEGVFA